MPIRLKLETILYLPAGTSLPDADSDCFTLPNGDTLRPFVALELNGEGALDKATGHMRRVYLERSSFTFELIDKQRGKPHV